MAILLYLDDIYPHPRLFPLEPFAKAKMMEVCELINSGIQPLQNLGVLNELGARFAAGQESKNSWCQFWINKGLRALERILAPTAGSFCFGDEPSAADCCLIPQLFAAKRFGVDVSAYPTLLRIDKAASVLPAFQNAEPSRQPDFT
jgi:maleylacetoacetate isomerase